MIINNAIMSWAGTVITDHNRSPLEVSIERIERKQRMAMGSLRRYVIAKKKSWSCSWEMLPHENAPASGGELHVGRNALTTANGEDGVWMENFHNTTDGPFTLTIRDGRGNSENFTVMIAEFSKEIVKRGAVDFWNLSVTLEQV